VRPVLASRLIAPIETAVIGIIDHVELLPNVAL